MARRADVRRVEAPLAEVWDELVRGPEQQSDGAGERHAPSTDPHPSAGPNPAADRDRTADQAPSANADPQVGETFVVPRGSGRQLCTVTEIGHEDFVHFRCQFQGTSGFLQHLAFVNGTVDADYEVKSARDGRVTYIRAIADYTAPLWPTAIAIVFALGALIGMNTGGIAGTFVMGSVMAFWIIVGAAMQYLPRRFAFKYVTGPVLDRLTRHAEVAPSPSDAGSDPAQT